jgi:hypothetical protein
MAADITCRDPELKLIRVGHALWAMWRREGGGWNDAARCTGPDDCLDGIATIVRLKAELRGERHPDARRRKAGLPCQ